MSNVHLSRQGFLNKLALPSITRTGSDTVGVNVNTLINGNEAAGNQCNTEVIDSSTNNHFVGQFGGFPSQTQFSPFGSGVGGSIFFDGFGDWLMCPITTTLTLGTGDFTIEFWFYAPDVSTTQGFYDQRNSTSAQIVPTVYISGGTVRYFTNNADRITSAAVAANTWHHIAVVRISGVTTMYLNGTATGSTYADTNNYVNSTQHNRPIIGSLSNRQYMETYINANSLRGFMSNVRVVKGIGVYTGNFTVPISPLTATQGAGTNIAAISGTETSLLLNFTNYRVLDSSTNNIKGLVPSSYQPCPLGGQTNFHPYSGSGKYGSYWFDGSQAFIDSPSNNDFQFNGDFTIEAWIYRTDINAQKWILSWFGSNTSWPPPQTQTGWIITVESNNRLAFYGAVGTTITIITATSTTIPRNAWTHIAITRSGTTVRLYVNGVQDSVSGTISGTTNSPTVPLRIGGDTINTVKTGGTLGLSSSPALYTSAGTFNGYITGVRIVKGTAVYTGTFTPPNIQPVDVSGASSAASYSSTANVNTTFASSQTSLLCKFDNWTMADNGPLPKPIYPAGSMSTYTSPSMSGFGNSIGAITSTRSEIYFPSFAFTFGASTQFTIAGWLYFQSGQPIVLISSGLQSGSGGSQQRLVFYIDASRNLKLNRLGSGDLVSFTTLSTALNNTWVHLAFTRNASGVILAYVNGTAGATTFTYTGAFGDFGATMYNYTYDGSWPVSSVGGFLDNWWSTPNLVYTANFTPENSPTTNPVPISSSITNNIYGMYQNF